MQFHLESYYRAFSILITFACPKRLIGNGNYTALVKPAAMLSLKYPRMEALSSCPFGIITVCGVSFKNA